MVKLTRMHPLIETHRAELLALARRRGVTGVRVFGSMSRGDGSDVFVHFRAIRGNGFRTLADGQKVEFAVTSGEKGPQAEDVVMID